MYTFYLIPGIIADHRSFRYLCHEMKFQACKFINWIEPEAGDSLATYAARLAKTQIDPATKPAFIGVSMGGIMAVELAKLYEDAPVALIASAKCRHELPPYVRRLSNVLPERYIPVNLLRQILLRLKPEKTHVKPEYFQLFRQMLLDTNPAFFRWSLGAIARWQQQHPPQNFIHLHGTDDKLLPPRFIKHHHPIPGGKHFMIVEKAPEIADILTDWQSKIQKIR